MHYRKNIVFAALLFFGLAVFGQMPESTEKRSDKAMTESNVIILGARPIIMLRATIANAGPAERVALITSRLKMLVAKGKIGEIETFRRSEGMMVTVGNEFVFMIANDDVDKASGETMEQLTARTVTNLQTALNEAIYFRSWPFIMRSVAEAFAATVILFLLIFAGRLLLARLIAFSGRLEGHVIKKINLRAYRLVDDLIIITRAAFRMVSYIILLVLVFIWLIFILHCIPATRLLGMKIAAYMINILETFLLSMVNSIPNLFLVIIIIMTAYFFSRMVKMFFQRVEEKRIILSTVPPDLARPTAKIVNIMLWLLAIIVAYPYMPGNSSEAFKGVSIFVGVIISLGSAGIFAQLMAGITLMYSRAFKAGDVIKAGDIVGKVLSIGYLSTRIWTVKNEEISMPNTILLTTATWNLSNSAENSGLLAQTRISIGYDTPWRTVHELLVNAARKTSGINVSPEPYVLQPELADFYVIYELNFYLKTLEERRQTMSDLHANIQDEFNQAGLQIMSPHFVGNPPEKVYVPPEKWHEH